METLPLPKKWTPLNPALLHAWDMRMRAMNTKDRIAIIHDADPDGICAAAILTRLIERIRGKTVDLRLAREDGNHNISPDMITQLKKNKITHIITADLPVEENTQTLNQAAQFAHIIIIDHHKILSTPKNKKVLLIKPQLIWKEPNPAYYATAKMAYDLGSRICDLRDLEWIAGAGLIGDSGFMQWSTYLTALLKRLRILSKKNWFDTELGKVPSTISLALCFNKKYTARCYDELLSAKTWKEFNASTLKKYRSAVEKEIKKHIHQFATVKQKDGIYLYEMKPSYRITGTLSTILGHKHAHKTVIIVDSSQDPICISARRNDSKIATNELLTCAIKNISGARGGGHIPAAGASVPKKHYHKFKEELYKTSKLLLKNQWVV